MSVSKPHSERDWCVTFARRVAEERSYSASHPGHVFLVMLHREEAEGLLEQANEVIQVVAELRAGRYDPECDCCRRTAEVIQK